MGIRISRRHVMIGGVAAVAITRLGTALAQAKPKVACVHASPIENAWNSVIHSALTAAAADGAIEYVYSEGVAAGDYARAMREYADQGAVLVFGESYAVERDARQVAADYPKTAFLMGSSGGPDGSNFGVFSGKTDEAGYLSGIVSGYLSKSKIFGSVGGMPIPEVNRAINAFRTGVKEVVPDAKFLVGYIGTWFDPAKTKETAYAQMDAGADVLYGERIGTVAAAADRGMLAVGTITDFRPQFPKNCFANVIWNFRPTVDAALADVLAGKSVAKDYTEYSLMKHGGNDCLLNEVLLPPEAVAAMKAKKAAIVSGAYTLVDDITEPT